MDEIKLLRSRELANSIRYSGDLHDSTLGLQPSTLQEVTDLYYRTAVEIHDDLTPDLEKSVIAVCNRLRVERSVVTVFVNSSLELQAACYYTDTKKCLVRFSSSLVNLLDSKEFEFVLGHELGHFLLQHAPSATNSQSAEYFSFQRSKEISADRMGLVGVGDFVSSARALIKTASGLEGRFLGMNIDHYLTQIDRIINPRSGEHPFSTHPSMLIRAKALYDFSKGDFHKHYGSIVSKNLIATDTALTKTLDTYLDSNLREKIKKALDDLVLWSVAKKITMDGKFDKIEQEKFQKHFGIDVFKKFKNFLKSANSTNLREEIENKLSDVKLRLKNLSPSSYKTNCETAEKMSKLF